MLKKRKKVTAKLIKNYYNKKRYFRAYTVFHQHLVLRPNL